jgi:phenylpropionate dioxygenase-like ring-hydroxylating dioxygenase large terminal subunit
MIWWTWNMAASAGRSSSNGKYMRMNWRRSSQEAGASSLTNRRSPNPGDFVASYIAEDPVLVVSDSRGNVGAFLNTCRHRGMRVCRPDAGNAAAFTCTYHGWTYGNDGKLVDVPGYKEYYYEELDMEQWGLVPIELVDTYAGLIFGTFDSTSGGVGQYANGTLVLALCFGRG